MEIDFHFGVTYVVGRLAGFDHPTAVIVATASQYVDDTVNSGPVAFKTGEAYDRRSTSHKPLDFHNLSKTDERLVWVSFHFLPGNNIEGGHPIEFYNRMVCRPNSSVARAMVRSCLTQSDRPFGLHQLGITVHVLMDTWAHQGFAGIIHPINFADEVRFKVNDTEQEQSVPSYRRGLWNRGEYRAFFQTLVCGFSPPVGHGRVLHYPDQPFRRWSYVNGFNQRIERDNPKDFLEAAEELYKVFRRYLLKKPDASAAETGSLSETDRAILGRKLRELRDEDAVVRNDQWIQAVNDGEFRFGRADLKRYQSFGEGSWKYEALGVKKDALTPLERFDYRPEFITSHWKQFHDAARMHQLELLREILSRFELCVI